LLNNSMELAMRHLTVLIVALLLCNVSRAELTVLITADTEGHVAPCRTCPINVGDGGLARRATIVLESRAHGGEVLLLDAGNFLFGPDSADSKGRVIVAAYNAMSYDAVNLSFRDLRLGKSQSLEQLREAKFEAVSANLLDDVTGNLLVKPYVVKRLGTRRVAILGLTDPPAGWQHLPALKEQLSGVKIVPSADALIQWLPKARADSDEVILLYYGRPSGLAHVLAKAGSQIAFIAVGGITEDELGPPSQTPVVWAQSHGKSVAELTWSPGTAPKLKQLSVSPDIEANPAMQQILAPYTSEPPTSVVVAAPATVQPPLPPSPALSVGPPATQPLPDPHRTSMPAPSGPQATAAPQISPTTRPAIAMAGSGPSTRTAPSATHDSPTVAVIPIRRRVTARQPMIPRGLAGVDLTDEKVNAAIDKGRDFLWDFLQKEHAKTPVRPLVDDAEDLLSTVALVNAGAHRKIPEFDAQLRTYLSGFNPRERQLGTYECGLFCMLVEAYGDPIFLPKLRDTARYLVELQGEGGSWNYGRSIPPSIYGELSNSGRALQVFGGTAFEGDKPSTEELKRITPYAKNSDGDNSVSQFALLGLHSAARWHIQASPEMWRRSLEAYRQRQCDDGGWDYDQTRTTGYGSMTCAGLCALAINRYQLGEKDAVADEQIERGLAWLDDKFSVTQNPVRATYNYYYLYSLERVGRILNTEFIGSHEWYPLGARYLIDAQKPSGKWVESTDDENPRQATSFALLFLTRATSTLTTDINRNGSGELRTSLAAAPPAQLYVILDASGSMLDEMDGQLKFDLARNAVTAMLSLLPTRSQVALRVYGHRKRSIEPGADEDTELLVPMHPYDAAKMGSTLKSLRSRGKTPMALSLTQAAADIGSPREPTTVVLLTDGGEDTMPRRDPIVAAGAFANLPDLNFHIIGFDVNQEDWNTQLRAMATAAGGHYWAAPKGKDLLHAMRAALLGDPDEFSVVDRSGKEVHRGKFGEATRLPEGKYVIVTTFSGKEFRQPIWINTNGITAVAFDATQVRNDRTGTTAAPVAETPAGAGTPAVPSTRFCTNCGKPVLPLAKFCTNCGAKVESKN
jgi:Mg-chelatase subunit ChlD